jgi:geranylgeranyl diphosphate synthase type II
MATSSIMNDLKTLRSSFETYLQNNTFQSNHPTELYEPLDYLLSIGGKRMRPLLTLLACNLFTADYERALPAAYAVELFHNFSLMHDDIMDKAPLRRGKTTVHELYDTNTAILSGDVMLVYAYQYLAQCPTEQIPALLQIFNEVAIGVCEGQQMDVNFETNNDVLIEEYIRMIELKTSVLVYGAMKIGALLGGAPEQDAQHLGEFGRNMGIAFQLQDDLLDTFGEKAKVGKRIGGDILQNKKTYLVLKALELADEATATELTALLSSTVAEAEEEAKIARVTSLFDKLNIQEELHKIIRVYNDKALASLDAIELAEEQKAPLKAFLKSIMARDY